MRHVVEEPLRSAQWREVRGKSGSDDLEDAFRVEQILERMGPEVAQRDAGWQAVARQVAGDPRDDDLLAVRGGEQSGDTVERGTEIIAGAPFRRAGVNCHPDFEGNRCICRFGSKGFLSRRPPPRSRLQGWEMRRRTRRRPS